MEPTDPITDPFAALLHELLHSLLSAGLYLGAGALLGGWAVQAMRETGLRWTWALLAFALLLPLHAAFGGWGYALLAAALWATVRSRHLHYTDLRLGLDLADAAGARRGPLQAAQALLARRHLDDPPTPEPGRISLGRTAEGEPVTIPRGGRAGGRHALVLGTTGSGKTVTQSRILAEAIAGGMGAVVIDPKGDEHLRATLARAAQADGRRLIEWTPHGPSVYNPLASGSPSSIADKALAGERFTEPHYQRQAQRYLGHAVRALRQAGQPVSLATLVEQLQPERLELLARSLPAPAAQRTHAYLDGLTPRQRADLSGVRDRLAILAESDVAPWLDPQTDPDASFELLEAIEQRAVVYFDLAADMWPLLAHMLAVAIVQDLLACVATLQRDPTPTLVAIDEFSAIAPEEIVRLFARARSAGVSLLLGTQEVSDLRLPGRERLLERVLGNLSTIVVHRQVVPESAELIASICGRRPAWQGSRSSDGRWTHARTLRPVLDAELVRLLPVGSAVVIEPGAPGADAAPPTVRVQA